MQRINERVTDKIQAISAGDGDSADARLQKSLLVFALILVMLATLLWGVIYFSLGEPQAGWISIAYSLITLGCLFFIWRTRRIWGVLYLQLLLGLLLPFTHSIMLGGFQSSGAVIIWSLISPLGALFFLDRRRALPWIFAFPLLLALAALLQALFPLRSSISPAMASIFFVMNIGAVSAIVLVMLAYFVSEKESAYRQLAVEQEKAENLLLNILPREIADILKNGSKTIADSFSGASILFADLVGFTPLTAKMEPVEMVNLLNQIFSYFDSLVEKYDLEKIRTIGDNYMVASGVPRPRPDHAHALAQMALDMQAYIDSLPPVNGRPVRFRVGINSGPVIGGVIGRKKFVYDLWGDAVNIASRMESHGVAGKIQITESTYKLICDDFICEERGLIDIKGRGPAKTWFILGLRVKDGEDARPSFIQQANLEEDNA